MKAAVTRKTARRGAGFATLSAAVAHAGIYRFPQEGDAMTSADEIEGAIEIVRKIVEGGKRILVIGGASGAYGQTMQRDQRVIHLVSTETGGRRDHTFTLPTKVGVVLVTRFAAASLTRDAQAQAKAAGIPAIGLFKSYGAVTRILQQALGWTDTSEPAAPTLRTTALAEGLAGVRVPHVDPTPTIDRPFPAPVQAAPVAAPAEEPAPLSAEETERELIRVFDEAQSALSLARETALTVYRDAVSARKDSESLRQLKALLKAI